MKNQTTSKKLTILCECGIMLALASVLSLIKVWESPYGGSVTLLSMLPIMLMSLRRGVRVGLATSFAYSILQIGLDLGKLMGYGMTVGIWIGCIVFDYLIPYTILGLAGLWRNRGVGGKMCGVAMVSVIRYISHVISGCVFFGTYAWEGWNPLPYSLVYNAIYMLPEMALTVIAAYALFRLKAFKKFLD
ncbi:MAG: energy-coupled thiamine transporter ThiT [Clostridia bacterium]|nr:energy-coupled thiamine transporter ThiT [Clostridia bacterium]